jgi:hypothetical protein
MFLLLMLTTLLLAFAVSWAVARMFEASMRGVLQRIIADDISLAWLQYLKFAILVVGTSAGVRIREFERYLNPLRGDKENRMGDFTLERWLFEAYRTVIESLQGITWMLLVFFVFAMIAFVIVRIAELRFGHVRQWPRNDVPGSSGTAGEPQP